MPDTWERFVVYVRLGERQKWRELHQGRFHTLARAEREIARRKDAGSKFKFAVAIETGRWLGPQEARAIREVEHDG